MDLTPEQFDELTAEELACFLSENCMLPNEPHIDDLTEEELDHYMRSMRDYQS